MASPSSGATGSTRIFGAHGASAASGMVSVTTSSSMLDCAQARDRRARTAPACVAQASTSGAPAARTASAAAHSVPGRVDHVVDDDGGAPVDLADDLHLGDLVRRGAPLVDDREVRVEPLGEGAGALDAAGVGRDHGDLAAPEALAQVLEQDRRRVDVVDRDVEEALDLPGVQVDGEHARRAGGGDQVGDELRADRDARARPSGPAARSRSTG